MAQESQWHDHQGAVQTRIVAASHQDSSEMQLFGWEAKLSEGWKAYWRSPGEAGLPVRVFRGETEVELLYPYPERFDLFGLETYGYSKQVILPFYLNTPDTGVVEVRADFMVCKDICIPFTAHYSLQGDVASLASSSHDIRFDAWLQKVPDRDTATKANLGIEAVQVKGVQGMQKLVVDVRADHTLENADLLVEVGDAFHFGTPEVHLLEDGTRARIVVGAMAARGAPNLKGQEARFTFSDGAGNAIDRRIMLK